MAYNKTCFEFWQSLQTCQRRTHERDRGGFKCDTGIMQRRHRHTAMIDYVNHPPHYADGKIEVIDFIDDKKLSYCLGNAVKYIARAGKKDPEKICEDLEKAVWYIKHEIERLGS
jgi:hypothetical protein